MLDKTRPLTTTHSRRRMILQSNDETSLQGEINLRSTMMSSHNSKASIIEFTKPTTKALRKKTSARSLKDSSKLLGDKVDLLKQTKESHNERESYMQNTLDRMQTYSLLSRNIQHKDQIIAKFTATCENSHKEANQLKTELNKCEDLTRQIYSIMQKPYIDDLNAVLLADQVKDVQSSVSKVLNISNKPKVKSSNNEDYGISFPKTTSTRELTIHKSLGFLHPNDPRGTQTTSYKMLSTKRSRLSSGLSCRPQASGSIVYSEIGFTLGKLLKRAKSVLESV